MKTLFTLIPMLALYCGSAFAIANCTSEQAQDGANHTNAEPVVKAYAYNGWSLEECKVITLKLVTGSQCNASIKILETETLGSNPTYKIVPCTVDEDIESESFLRKIAPNEDPLLR